MEPLHEKYVVVFVCKQGRHLSDCASMQSDYKQSNLINWKSLEQEVFISKLLVVRIVGR